MSINKNEKKMVTYYLTLSQVFPKGHINEGELTLFEQALRKAVDGCDDCPEVFVCLKEKKWCVAVQTKVHTIRANYEFWKKRFEKIEKGEACLSVRQWVGKPYGEGSTMREIMRLTKDDGIGIQKLTIEGVTTHHPIYVDGNPVEAKDVAKNDGLDEPDWHSWFRGYDVTKPMAVIHFTKFRY